MTSGELGLKMAMLENFQLNIKRVKYDSETKSQLIKQAKRILDEVEKAISDGELQKTQVNEFIKKFKLSSFVKEVRLK